MRETLLPGATRSPLTRQVKKATLKWEENLQLPGFAGAPVPEAGPKKDPATSLDLAWQYLFPARKPAFDPPSGRWIQTSLHPSLLQKAVKNALVKAGITKKASCRTFRHSFAAHLLEDGYDVRVVQGLLGHQDVSSTMIYLQIMGRNVLNVKSPLD